MPTAGNYKISALEMTNFRQYRQASVKFSRDPSKPFTIIRGVNGAGKTNIMNAITWCLYGTEKHARASEKDLPIVNTKAVKEKPEGIVRMGVKLVLADEEGDKFIIERRLSLFINGQGGNTVIDRETGLPIPEGSTPTVTPSFQRYTDGGWESTEYFDASVKSLLPEDLAAYFLFDGEKLEDFFDQAENTRKGIKDVSQIGMIESAGEMLRSKILPQKRKSAKNLAPQAARYQADMEEARQRLESAKEQIRKHHDKLDSKKKRMMEIERSIARAGGDVSTYQERAIGVKKSIEDAGDQLSKAKSEVRGYVLEHMPGVLLLEQVERTLDLIKSKGDEGILPPKIKDTFINEILDGGQCICGCDISAGTEHRAKVEALLKTAQYSAINTICTEIRFELKPLLDTGGVKSDLVKRERQVIDCEKRLGNLVEQKKELEAKIGSADDESVRKLHGEKVRLDGEISEITKSLGAVGQQKIDLSQEYERLRTAYDTELRKAEEYTDLVKELDFCIDALDGLEKVGRNLLESVRSQVQERTKTYFMEFLWKKDTYDDVDIDKDYNMSAHHVDGGSVRDGLSAGEKLVLAMSFMAALRKITGFSFPLVIDTPFGRVSGEPRHNIARSLPNFLQGTQVTLLVTDTEYQAQVQSDDKKQVFPPMRDALDMHVGADHSIRYSGGESKVEAS